jgi:hypothetical protein
MSKNLWALNKDPAIKAILLLLQHQTGAESFLLLDEDRLNDKAIRIATLATQTELAAYIYSYGQSKERYGLDLEFPYLIATEADDQTIRLNDLTAEEVLAHLVDHLEMIDFGQAQTPG